MFPKYLLKSSISSIYLYFSEGFLTNIYIYLSVPRYIQMTTLTVLPLSTSLLEDFFSERSPSMWWANIHPCRENFDKVIQSPFPNSGSKRIDRWMNISKLFFKPWWVPLICMIWSVFFFQKYIQLHDKFNIHLIKVPYWSTNSPTKRKVFTFFPKYVVSVCGVIHPTSCTRFFEHRLVMASHPTWELHSPRNWPVFLYKGFVKNSWFPFIRPTI